MCFVVQNSICEISYGDGGGIRACKRVPVLSMSALMVETPQSIPTAPSMQRHTMRVVWVIGCADISKNSNYG